MNSAQTKEDGLLSPRALFNSRLQPVACLLRASLRSALAAPTATAEANVRRAANIAAQHIGT